MKQKRLIVYVEHIPTREELRSERRWLILDNVLNIILGLAIVAVLFLAGYLVGSGAVLLESASAVAAESWWPSGPSMKKEPPPVMEAPKAAIRQKPDTTPPL